MIHGRKKYKLNFTKIKDFCSVKYIVRNEKINRLRNDILENISEKGHSKYIETLKIQQKGNERLI
jgi:hypothetical protein